MEAADLLAIVEASMSSEIYELMKRSDEVEVVEKAHRHPRFVEDCVREMVRMATERYAALGERAFISARQENLETIHKHNVVAERHGLIADLAREIATGESERPSRDRARVARRRLTREPAATAQGLSFKRGAANCRCSR